jgi:hypothetical protein
MKPINKNIPFSFKGYSPLLFSAFLILGSTSSSQASILASSDFDSGYTDGALAGQPVGTSDNVGLVGTYTYTPDANDTNGFLNVSSGGITYSNGSVYIPGGSNSVDLQVSTSDFEDLSTISFANAISGQNVYERVVLDAVNPAANQYFLAFALNGDNLFNDPPLVGVDANAGASGEVGAQVGTAEAGSSVTSADFTGTNLLVAEFVWDANTQTYNTVNFFLNPSSGVQGTPTSTASITDGSSGPSSLSSFSLDVGNMNASTTAPVDYDFDSLAVGTTYADVVTTPEPSSLALILAASISLLAVTALRKRLN